MIFVSSRPKRWLVLQVGGFNDLLEIEEAYFFTFQLYHAVFFEFGEQADGGLRGGAHEVGDFFPGEADAQGVAVGFHAVGFFDEQQGFCESFPHRFLGEVGDFQFRFAQFAGEDAHHFKRQGGIFLQDAHKQVFRNKADGGVFEGGSGGGVAFVAEQRFISHDIAGFHEADNLFTAIVAAVGQLYFPVVDTVNTKRVSAFVEDHLTFFVHRAYFGLVNLFQIALFRLAENGGKTVPAMLASRILNCATHINLQKY